MSCITSLRSPWHLASSQILGSCQDNVPIQRACSSQTPFLTTLPRKDASSCNRDAAYRIQQRLVHSRAMLSGGHQETAAGPIDSTQSNLILSSQREVGTREWRELRGGCETEAPEQLDAKALPLKRRTATLAAVAVASPLLRFGGGSALAEEAANGSEANLTLIPYKDQKEGFSLLRPEGWEVVEKAGATLLIEDPNNRKNSIGVVVSPVRIDSLSEFGDAKSVGEKLLVAERKKGSTNSATMLRIDVRTAPTAGAPLYVLEYALDSSRGVKRTLTAVTIVRKKLFIVNIAYPDSPKAPAPAPLANALHDVLESFDVER